MRKKTWRREDFVSSKTKTCNGLCGKRKPADKKHFSVQPRNSDGLRGDCKECYNAKLRATKARDPEKHKAYQRKWNRDNSYRHRGYNIKRYGLTMDQYNDILERQNNKCVGCDYEFGQRKGDINIDHCHETDVVRGLLCTNCNHAIGKVKDSPSTLRQLARYLEKCSATSPERLSTSRRLRHN